METWLEAKGWEMIEGRLSKGYRWEAQLAERKNNRGRAIGGMLIGVRESITEEKGKVTMEKGEEGLLVTEFETGGEKWRMMGVYVNRDIKEKMKKIRT